MEDLNDPVEVELCKKSVEARYSAYAPYSRFNVGCSILLDNDKLVTGSNQENAVYPLGLCAERVALFAACHSYPNQKILKLAVSTPAQHTKPAFPCGSCRQAILEQELKQKNGIKVFVVTGDNHVFVAGSLSDLMPFPFSDDHLNTT